MNTHTPLTKGHDFIKKASLILHLFSKRTFHNNHTEKLLLLLNISSIVFLSLPQQTFNFCAMRKVLLYIPIKEAFD